MNDPRPITIMWIIQELYCKMLFLLVAGIQLIRGSFQHGTQKGWQAIALIMLLWLVLEKATKWGHACLIGSLDLFEALVALDGADC